MCYLAVRAIALCSTKYTLLHICKIPTYLRPTVGFIILYPPDFSGNQGNHRN